jgi:uncharacterized protein YbaR (Trm112 family)
MHGDPSIWSWPMTLIVVALLGLIPATIARRKGYSFWFHWAFGAAVFPVALLSAIVTPFDADRLNRRAERRASRRGEIRCPACREFVRSDATICPHCRTTLAAKSAA